jgi:hypothetical protein
MRGNCNYRLSLWKYSNFGTVLGSFLWKKVLTPGSHGVNFTIADQLWKQPFSTGLVDYAVRSSNFLR